jgi:hypothetical protein
LTVRRLLAILTRRWTTVSLLRGSRRQTGLTSLLVLRVVTWVNGAKNELDHPKIRSEINRRVRAGHLGGFVLII